MSTYSHVKDVDRTFTDLKEYASFALATSTAEHRREAELLFDWLKAKNNTLRVSKTAGKLATLQMLIAMNDAGDTPYYANSTNTPHLIFIKDLHIEGYLETARGGRLRATKKFNKEICMVRRVLDADYEMLT